MTDNTTPAAIRARERLDKLLAEQHLFGMMTSQPDREKYLANWLEIFRLVKVADLSPLMERTS
jgi:hypothetical protein